MTSFSRAWVLPADFTYIVSVFCNSLCNCYVFIKTDILHSADILHSKKAAQFSLWTYNNCITSYRIQGLGRERLERMQYARIDTIFWEINIDIEESIREKRNRKMKISKGLRRRISKTNIDFIKSSILMSWDWANAWRIHVNFLFFEWEVTILDNFGRPVRIVLNIVLRF